MSLFLWVFQDYFSLTLFLFSKLLRFIGVSKEILGTGSMLGKEKENTYKCGRTY